MSLTEREVATQIKYDATANEWLERSGGRNRPCFWADEVNELRWMLEERDKVIELGCGPATDGMQLQMYGLDCVSVDYSTSMLKIARELNSNAKLAQMDIYQTAFPENSFNGFWASATILHLEKPQKALQEIVRITKDKSAGFISVKEGEGDGIDPRTGFYFRYFTNE